MAGINSKLGLDSFLLSKWAILDQNKLQYGSFSQSKCQQVSYTLRNDPLFIPPFTSGHCDSICRNAWSICLAYKRRHSAGPSSDSDCANNICAAWRGRLILYSQEWMWSGWSGPIARCAVSAITSSHLIRPTFPSSRKVWIGREEEKRWQGLSSLTRFAFRELTSDRLVSFKDVLNENRELPFLWWGMLGTLSVLAVLLCAGMLVNATLLWKQ